MIVLKRFLLISTFLVVSVIVCLIVTSKVSSAADRFWVGDSGDMSQTAHWSTSSGGAGGASVPGANDNAFVNASSFSIDGNITTSSRSIGTLSFSGLDQNVSLEIAEYESLTLKNFIGDSQLSIPVIDSGGYLYFTSADSIVLQQYGADIDLPVEITVTDLNDRFELQSSDMVIDSSITLADGRFRVNGFNVTCLGFVLSAGADEVNFSGQNLTTASYADYSTNLLTFVTPELLTFTGSSNSWFSDDEFKEVEFSEATTVTVGNSKTVKITDKITLNGDTSFTSDHGTLNATIDVDYIDTIDDITSTRITWTPPPSILNPSSIRTGDTEMMLSWEYPTYVRLINVRMDDKQTPSSVTDGYLMYAGSATYEETYLGLTEGLNKFFNLYSYNGVVYGSGTEYEIRNAVDQGLGMDDWILVVFSCAVLGIATWRRSALLYIVSMFCFIGILFYTGLAVPVWFNAGVGILVAFSAIKSMLLISN